MQPEGPDPLGGPSVNGFITSSGIDFVGADGQKVILKGINLGSWLNQEMWMMDVKDPDIPDQYTFEKVLKDRFGESERQRLMDLYRANWITERDYKIVKSFGRKVVRL
jgi:glucan 1,3-beta-glucosidase